MLITHRGLSGPAILQISSYWKPGTPIAIDLAPGQEVTLATREAKTRDLTVARKSLERVLPNRFAVALARIASASVLHESGSRRFRTTVARVEDHSRRNRRIRKSRGHRRRSRYQRALRKNHGEPQSARPLLHRRSRRRHRPSRRIQLPVGLGFWSRRRPSDVSKKVNRVLSLHRSALTRGHWEALSDLGRN